MGVAKFTKGAVVLPLAMSLLNGLKAPSLLCGLVLRVLRIDVRKLLLRVV